MSQDTRRLSRQVAAISAVKRLIWAPDPTSGDHDLGVLGGRDVVWQDSAGQVLGEHSLVLTGPTAAYLDRFRALNLIAPPSMLARADELNRQELINLLRGQDADTAPPASSHTQGV